MRTLPILVVLLAGCAGSDPQKDPQDQAVPAAPRTDLVVEYRPDPAVAATRLTLTCDPPGGEHPDPPAACKDLAAEQTPFAPVPAGSACTQVYGGPQTATVRGTYRGQEVVLDLSRTDGCQIAQWDRLGALLPEVAP